MPAPRFAPAAAVLLAASVSHAADFRTFADAHCVSCHGPDGPRGGLRLDTFPPPTDRDAAARWVRVFDRLDRGEMPPKANDRPPAADTAAALASLRKELHAASLARQAAEGRVALRRLNRTEYETTLRDLLGTTEHLKEILPDDNSAAGFDNVAAALDVSAAHLLRYQDAAERALRGVIPTRPQVTIKERYTGRQITEKFRGFTDLLNKVVRLDGDTLMVYARPWDHVPTATAPVPATGRYKVRASLAAVGTDRPLPVRLAARDQYGRDDPDGLVRDIPPGPPVVIELEIEMKARQIVNFTGWSLPTIRNMPSVGKGPLAEYAGPGLAVQWVEVEGPLDPWPGAGYGRLFGNVPLKPASVAKLIATGHPEPAWANRKPDAYIYDPLTPVPADPKADAARLVRAFLPVAFRRPVPAGLADYYVNIVHAALDAKTPFADAMLLGYRAALCSPHFLFLAEPTPAGPKLDGYAVAARLSYFLWSSLPDDELTRLAAAGELAKPDVLRGQVERMLKHPRAARFATNFAGQWLDLRAINATSPDPQVYAEFDDFLFWAMPRETRLFFDEMLANDRPVSEFVHSDWTFLNQRLAQHYGIPGVTGGEMRKVPLPPGAHRGGVLTQAAVLKVTADGTRTSPVLRGKWVLEKIIGKPPAPPPPDIPGIEPDIRGATTIREQLDKHRSTPACAACHNHIDPPGFALETFDVIGGWREFYRGTRGPRAELPNYPGRTVARGRDVETGGTTPDGKPFAGIDAYKQYLLADKDQIARNLVQKLMVYATGADIQFADREEVERIVAKARARGHGFRTLLHEVVQSRVFLNK